MKNHLSTQEINDDIDAYRERIRVAQKKRDELPSWNHNWRVRLRNRNKAQAYDQEIRHIERLIKIAESARP